METPLLHANSPKSLPLPSSTLLRPQIPRIQTPSARGDSRTAAFLRGEDAASTGRHTSPQPTYEFERRIIEERNRVETRLHQASAASLPSVGGSVLSPSLVQHRGAGSLGRGAGGGGESFSLSDYYNEGAVRRGGKDENPYPVEGNKDISLMSTIRALNSELNKIEENEAARAVTPQPYSSVGSQKSPYIQLATSSSAQPVESYYDTSGRNTTC